MDTNISSSIESLSSVLSCISQPARIQILLALKDCEACVCHLEAVLGMNQACISQHLMVLRENNLVATRREGRHIFYSLANPEILDVFRMVAGTNMIEMGSLETLVSGPVPGCPCPTCSKAGSTHQ